MKGRRLFALSAIALALGCEGHQSPTAPSVLIDPSKIISDGAHCSNPGIVCNPDFFFLPPLVPLPLHNPNFELGKFNNTLQPSLKIDICELKPENLNTRGLPTAATGCVGGDPLKTFAPGTVKLVNLPLRENGWWTLFGLPPDGFYYVLWDTRQSNLNVNKFYRIKVLIAGPPDVVLGVADVDPMSSLWQWKYTLTGEVIQLINGFFLPIPFRVEHGGGPALCGGAAICTSVTVTNHTPNGDPQIVQAQGNNGPLAGALFPDGWLPVGPGLPTSVVVTISSVNTGVNDVAAGTQANPCHAGLPLEQFNGCFKFTTTPTLGGFGLDGHQFARAVTVAVCYVLHDTGDPREKFVQLWSSGPNEPAHPLVSVSDALILTAPTEDNCGTNFVTVIGSNAAGSNALTQFASAGLRALKGGLGRVFGVKTAYAVDLGLGGLTLDFSNVGPALTARIERYTSTALTLGPGATTTSTVRIVGTQKHNGGALTTGIGGLPVTFTVAPGNGTLRLIGSEAPPAAQLTSITNTNPIDGSPTSGGGFAPVNWTMPTTPGTYTLTATGPATGGPVTFTATVLSAVGFNVIQGSLDAGGFHTCGLTTGGAAYCWGNNRGQLGDGTTTDRLVPTAVAGGLTFAALSAGDGASCGLTPTGAAYCWGFNTSGQLGDGTTTDRLSPTPVAGGLTFAALSAGNNNAGGHTCGVTTSGAAYCWGRNGNGQLGDGTTTDRLVPTPVAGGVTFAAVITGGQHTCGVTTSGAAYCWGFNGGGGLGDGTTTQRLVPTLVAGGLTFAALSAGGAHTCGVTPTSAVYCWGFNGNGQLGDNTLTQRLVPTPVGGALTFAGVSSGFGHTCGVTTTGAAQCWGFNGQGELGDGTTTERHIPTLVAGGLSFAAVSAGTQHTCGVTTSGVAYCWGLNGNGQVGDGTTTNRTTPVAVVNP